MERAKFRPAADRYSGKSSGVTAMGDVVSFNKAKKARARAEKDKTAAENRTKHGRSKGEKTRDAAERERREHELDGAKREGADKNEP